MKSTALFEPTFRPEDHGDQSAIRAVHLAAYGSPAEADLVDALRAENFYSPEMSWLACLEDEVVGHLLYSRLHLSERGHEIRALALAPMGVLPQYQQKGIGSLLLQASLAYLRTTPWEVIVVMGHTTFYPKFGFSVELGRKIRCPFSGDHLMAYELRRGILHEVTAAEAVYPEPFLAL